MPKAVRPAARGTKEFGCGSTAYKPVIIYPSGKTRVLCQDDEYRLQGYVLKSKREAVEYAQRYIDECRLDVIRRANGRTGRCSDVAIRNLQGEYELWGGIGDVFGCVP